MDVIMDKKTACVSHGEDADGLICAAMLRRLKDASTTLVTYDDFEDPLRRIHPPTEYLYICDLNIREELVEEILRINRFAHVTIIDHHPTSEGVLERLKLAGVTVVHSPLDCASALLYDYLEDDLGREVARLAVYAAVSDQFEDGPIAMELLSGLDRQLVQHEALILAHALHRETSYRFRSRVVEELSRFAFPHRIEGAVEVALAHIEHMAGLLEVLPEKASSLGRLAYAGAVEGVSLGAVAGLLVDAMGVDVGVCYKKGEEGKLNISIRGRRGLRIHLGEVTRLLATRRGGFGGGHMRASGASIQDEDPMEFIRALGEELEAAERG